MQSLDSLQRFFIAAIMVAGKKKTNVMEMCVILCICFKGKGCLD